MANILNACKSKLARNLDASMHLKTFQLALNAVIVNQYTECTVECKCERCNARRIARSPESAMQFVQNHATCNMVRN